MEVPFSISRQAGVARQVLDHRSPSGDRQPQWIANGFAVTAVVFVVSSTCLTITAAAGIVTTLALSYGAHRRPSNVLSDTFVGFPEVGDLGNG